MFLLDDTTNRGSEGSSPQLGGDSFGLGIDPETTSQAASAVDNPTVPLAKPIEDPAQAERNRLTKIAKDRIQNQIGNKISDKLGTNKVFGEDTPENRKLVKEATEKKAREIAQKQIGKRISHEGLQRGFQQGLDKSAGKIVKEGVSKTAGKAVGKGAAKVGTEAAEKAVVSAGSKAVTAGLEGVVDVAGAATGVETLGLGFVLAFLLNIAISLGVSDAVDAGFELESALRGKGGTIKQARFLAIRAAMKVGVFIYLLIVVICMFTIAGSIPAAFGLIWLNIYMVLGLIFREFGIFQGVVWWEAVIIIVMDIIGILIISALIGGIAYYLCSVSGLGSGGITGAATGAIASIYDWWTNGTTGSFADTICTIIHATPM